MRTPRKGKVQQIICISVSIQIKKVAKQSTIVCARTEYTDLCIGTILCVCLRTQITERQQCATIVGAVYCFPWHCSAWQCQPVYVSCTAIIGILTQSSAVEPHSGTVQYG